MCHYEVPPGEVTPDVAREDVRIPLPSGGAMAGFLARAASPTAPVVLVVHDIYGCSDFYKHLSCKLAAAGYTALLPDCFSREGEMPEMSREAAYERFGRLDEGRTLEDMQAALEWLTANVKQSAGPMGTIGFCMGGTIVLDLAARRNDLVTVCFYGFPAGLKEGTLAAPTPLSLADQIHGPILGLWGDADEVVGMDTVERLRAALVGRGVEFDCVIYPGAEHAFMGAPIRTPHPTAADDAWERTLAFYRKHLGR